MMNEKDRTDREISRALSRCADGISPSAFCKSRIMEEIREQETVMRQDQIAAAKHGRIRRAGSLRFGKAAGIAVVLTACAGTAVAGGKIGSSIASSRSGYDYSSYSSLDQAWEDTGLSADLPETFTNGYHFQGASLVSRTERSGSGKVTGKDKQLEVTYRSGKNEVSVLVSGAAAPSESAQDTVTLPDGTKLYYSSSSYLFLPADAEGKPLSEGEQSFADQPNHYISYGSDTQSTAVIDSVNVTDGGATYTFQCDHSDTSKDSLLNMAEEVVNN